jgi:hypothetical protein
MASRARDLLDHIHLKKNSAIDDPLISRILYLSHLDNPYPRFRPIFLWLHRGKISRGSFLIALERLRSLPVPLFRGVSLKRKKVCTGSFKDAPQKTFPACIASTSDSSS